jgi:4-amino-4-deoxy-L-arabinose transferase-like glycosyltransferase
MHSDEPHAEPTLPVSNLQPTSRYELCRAAFLVALYASCVLIPFLGSSRTLTPHEVNTVHPTLRMLEDGDWREWIVPHFGGGYWLDKPPLANWLTAIALAGAGVFHEMPPSGWGEFAARLPAAVSAIGLCVLMTVLAGRFFSARVALLTGLVQATCVYVYMEGRLAELDMSFAALLAAAHGVLLWNWGARASVPPGAATTYALSWRSGLLFHTVAALAVLTKGPLGVILLGASVLAFCVVRRTWQPLRAVLLTPGIAAFAAIAGGWHLAAWLLVGHEAIDQWFFNNLTRFEGMHTLGASEGFFSYLYHIPWLLLPWSVALLAGARLLATGLRGPQRAVHQYLWAWFVGGFAFLMVSLFKHKHYVVPVLPPFSIFAAIVLDAHIQLKGMAAKRFYAVVFATALVAFALVGRFAIPRDDSRRETVAFVRRAMALVPVDQTLYVVGAAQMPITPYITHRRCAYLDSPREVEEALGDRDGGSMWAVSIRRHLRAAGERGVMIEEVASEPPRARLPIEKQVVIAILRKPASLRP